MDHDPRRVRTLYMTNENWLAMRIHVNAAAPQEACGLLAGKGERVQTVLQMRNQAESQTRFLLDPQEQLQAFDWIDSQELELVGIFHSHPAGPEIVSAVDIAEAAYPVVQVIWSRPQGEWQARGFWIEDKQAVDVPLHIIPSAARDL